MRMTWRDKQRARRELLRQRDVSDAADEERIKAEVQRFKVRASQVIKESHRAGRDLTPLLNDIFERLAREEREARSRVD